MTARLYFDMFINCQVPKIMAQSDNWLAVALAVVAVHLEQFRLIGKVIWVGHDAK